MNVYICTESIVLYSSPSIVMFVKCLNISKAFKFYILSIYCLLVYIPVELSLVENSLVEFSFVKISLVELSLVEFSASRDTKGLNESR